METTEKRTVGRPARDPFAEQRATLLKVEQLTTEVRKAMSNASKMLADMKYVRAMFQSLNNQPDMDETAIRLSGIASGRLYFAQHFYPEFMVTECEYMLAGLNQLRIYLESQTPALRKEEKV